MNLLFFEKSVEIIKKRSVKIIFAVALVYLVSFSMGFFSGQSLRAENREEADEILQAVNETLSPVTGFYRSGEFIQLDLMIFFTNLRSMIFHTIFGLLIFPIFIFLFLGGSLTGMIFGIKNVEIISGFNFHEFAFMAIVFSLEFISLVLASTEGLYLGTSLLFPKKIFDKKISRKKAFITTLKQTARVYLIIIALLLIASVIETIALYSLWSRNAALVEI